MTKSKASDLNPSKRELRIELLITIVLCLISFYLRLPDRWLAAIYMTVPTFGAMVSIFRDRWTSSGFWVIVSGCLMLHAVLLWWLFGFVLNRFSEVPLAACVPLILLEASAIYYGIRRLEPLTSRRAREKPISNA